MESSTNRRIVSKMDERRQFIEDWGPYMLSGIPMLFALYLAMTFQPTRPYLIDPLIFVMAMMAFSGIEFLAVNVLGPRSPRACKVLFGIATAVAFPGALIGGVTQASSVQLAWISVAWGTAALIGKFRGFWWIQAPLERLSGVASRPEEWVQDWLEKYYDVNPFEVPADEALRRAKMDWNSMLDGGVATSDGQEAARSLLNSKPSFAARVRAFILDEDTDEEPDAPKLAVPKMFAFIMPKSEHDEGEAPKVSAADLLRRYRFDFEQPETEEDLEYEFEETGQKVPWWRRLFSDEAEEEDQEPESNLLNFFTRRRQAEPDAEDSVPEDDEDRLRRILREARR